MRLLFIVIAATAIAQTPEAAFQSRCAACHSAGNVLGAPPPETLRQMSSKAILAALETGKMKGIGAVMSPADRETVARIGVTESPPAPIARCTGSPRANGQWNGWADPANTRFAKSSGLTSQTTPKLRLKWAFGFPGVTTAFGNPTIVDGRVFVGDANGVVYSLDARSGCTYWTFTAAAGVRVAPVVEQGAGGKSVYFGDLRGNVYAVSSATGALLWKTRADDHSLAVISGSPKLDAGRLYVPVSGRDESIAATNPTYECCTFRGSVVALDAVTGKRIWKAYTVRDEPKVTGQNAKGVKTWGPSGAVPWSSPTIDVKARALYIGTGVNYSNPPTDTSDAVLAFDLDSGRLLWSRQFTAGDSYNFACGADDKTNCPKMPFVDYDFGHSPVLRNRILFAGDKGGTVYALDADQQGKLLWKRKIASGGVNGGFMWGGASDELGVAYIGISDFTAGKPETGGGLIALQLKTGERLWMTPAPKPACIGVPGCSAAQPAPVSVIPGVAFLGSSDGHMRAYETARGAIVWDFDTARDFQTVNGVKARGGSIISMGPVISGGMLYITSGYSGNGMPGNVLLAFAP